MPVLPILAGVSGVLVEMMSCDLLFNPAAEVSQRDFAIEVKLVGRTLQRDSASSTGAWLRLVLWVLDLKRHHVL
jgi:hypothetical protein